MVAQETTAAGNHHIDQLALMQQDIDLEWVVDQMGEEERSVDVVSAELQGCWGRRVSVV